MGFFRISGSEFFNWLDQIVKNPENPEISGIGTRIWKPQKNPEKIAKSWGSGSGFENPELLITICESKFFQKIQWSNSDFEQQPRSLLLNWLKYYFWKQIWNWTWEFSVCVKIRSTCAKMCLGKSPDTFFHVLCINRCLVM